MGFSPISPVLAANNWLVEEGDELVFNLTQWGGDEVIVDGSFTLTIEEKNSTGELMYSIITDFKIDKENYNNALEVDNRTTIGAVKLWNADDNGGLTEYNSLTQLVFVILLYTEDSFNDLVDILTELSENMDDSVSTPFYGTSYDFYPFYLVIEELGLEMEYSCEDDEFGMEYSLEGDGGNYCIKWLWDENGILKHWEWTITLDGVKAGVLINISGFSIPSFPMEVFMTIFAISTLGIIIRRRKNK